MNSISLCVFFIIVVYSVDGCGFLGGGGGGGCCCGGGGCGRRKRSVEFDGIASNNNDMLCNTPELKQIIVENMKDSSVESSISLQNALESHDSHRYVVVCAEHPFHYSIKHDAAYCGARNGSHYCQAFAI